LLWRKKNILKTPTRMATGLNQIQEYRITAPLYISKNSMMQSTLEARIMRARSEHTSATWKHRG